MNNKICFLSGLEIPEGRFSIEHYYPRSKIKNHSCNVRNRFAAHKVLNGIKSNLLPCVWEEMKIELTWKAIKHYHIKHKDKQFLRAAIKNWETYKTNPCEYCIARKYKELCIKGK